MSSFLGYFTAEGSPDEVILGEKSYLVGARRKQSGGRWTLILPDEAKSRSGNQTYKIDGDRGLFWGRLFDARDLFSSRGREISPHAAEKIIATDGKYLSRATWGRYAGVIASSDGRKLYLFRDPVGHQHLYYVEVPEGIWFGTDPLEVKSAADLAFAPDWKFIAPLLLDREQVPVWRTGIAGLHEVMAGEMLVLHSEGVEKKKFWDLRTIPEVKRRSHDRLVQELREILDLIARSWADSDERVAVHLSGGLDSACMLALLSNVIDPEAITCLNYYTADASLDERHYARLAADHLGVELLEIPMSELDPAELLRGQGYKTSRPLNRLLVADLDREIMKAAAERDCRQVWNGLGSDSVFISTPGESLLVDLYQDIGVAAAFGRSAELAFYRNTTIWKVLLAAGRDAISGRLRKRQNRDIRLRALYTDRLGSHCGAAIQSERSFDRPGKAYHLRDIEVHAWEIASVFSGPYHDPFEVINPFLSQPLLEWVASVPAYEFFCNFENRSILRSAFEDVLPQELVHRRYKGNGGAPIIRAFRHGAEEVIAAISEGELGRAGMVSEGWLREFLRPETTVTNQAVTELHSAFTVELWSRSWTAET